MQFFFNAKTLIKLTNKIKERETERKNEQNEEEKEVFHLHKRNII